MKNSAFQDFSEAAQDALDFARCQRPDGSYYGTAGQCRKGTPVDAKKLKDDLAKADLRKVPQDKLMRVFNALPLKDPFRLRIAGEIGRRHEEKFMKKLIKEEKRVEKENDSISKQLMGRAKKFLKEGNLQAYFQSLGDSVGVRIDEDEYPNAFDEEFARRDQELRG